MAKKTESEHGGARANAGRKAQFSEPTKVIRVPESQVDFAQDHVEQALDLNEFLIRNENSTFIVKANSLSMLDVGIDIDDPLVVDRSIPAKSGDIVIALIDNDFTVKRLMIDHHFSPPKVWLKAENPDYQNIYITEGQELVIWGVVTYNLKPMR